MPAKNRTLPLTALQNADIEEAIPKIGELFKEIISYVPPENQGKYILSFLKKI